jgi:hypothetical protein
MNQPELVVLADVTATEAQLLLGALQEAEIPAFTFGEMTAGTFAGNSALGEVQVVVPSRDWKRAFDIGSALWGQRWDLSEEDPAIDEGLWLCSICGEAVPEVETQCPSCQTNREEGAS